MIQGLGFPGASHALVGFAFGLNCQFDRVGPGLQGREMDAVHHLAYLDAVWFEFPPNPPLLTLSHSCTARRPTTGSFS